jgi:hypothetical protein
MWLAFVSAPLPAELGTGLDILSEGSYDNAYAFDLRLKQLYVGDETYAKHPGLQLRVAEVKRRQQQVGEILAKLKQLAPLAHNLAADPGLRLFLENKAASLNPKTGRLPPQAQDFIASESLLEQYLIQLFEGFDTKKLSYSQTESIEAAITLFKDIQQLATQFAQITHLRMDVPVGRRLPVV